MRYIIIIYAFVFFAQSCKSTPAEEENEAVEVENKVQLTEVQEKNAGIATAKLERRPMSAVLRVSGTIEAPPQNTVSVSVPLGGYLKYTKLLPGMHVNKGEVIAVMEDQQYIQLQQEYLTAVARLSYSESEYNRQKTLNESKAASDKVFQQAEAEYKSQRILVRSLYEKLKLIGVDPDKLNDNNISRTIRLHSPIDGYVTKVNVNIGKYVTPTEILFELVNPDDIHLALKIFEKDVNKLHIGQKLLAYTNTDTGRKYECEIMLIGKDITNERSLEVHCHFEKYDRSLIPGMYMNAEISVNAENRTALPEEAVVHHGNKEYVFVADGGNTYEMQEVKTGIRGNGYTEVMFSDTSGIVNRDFVVKGAYSLLMKMVNVESD